MLFGILKLGLHRRGLSARHKPWPPQLAIGRTVVAQRVSPSKKPKNHKQKSLARAKSSYGAEPVSPYPVMKVSCQIVQSYLVQFFLFGLRLDFVFFGFTIEILRYLDSVGLVLDSGPTSQITILRENDAIKLLSCWTLLDRVQHRKSLSYVWKFWTHAV